jgi:hypothetical protein
MLFGGFAGKLPPPPISGDHTEVPTRQPCFLWACLIDGLHTRLIDAAQKNITLS